MINIGVIGLGYWGPNVVRNFVSAEGAKVAALCDINSAAIKRIHDHYPHIESHKDYRAVTRSKNIDAVCIVTPVSTHYEIAMDALKNGKHVFIEKPFTQTVSEAEKLMDMARKNRLQIMVDHTFIFTGAVKKIKTLVSKGSLGDLYYYDSTRVNLGLFQHDVNVVWDLAPHDFSIMDHILDKKPEAVVAHGMDHFKRGLEDVAYITMYFPGTMIAHFNLNWISPVKIRTTFIGGKKKMLVWNDLESDEKIRIYDKGVEIKSKEGAYKLLVEYRTGDMWGPVIDSTEALKVEAAYFINCIVENKAPVNSGYSGLRIVKMLEAATKSLKNNGRVVKLNGI